MFTIKYWWFSLHMTTTHQCFTTFVLQTIALEYTWEFLSVELGGTAGFWYLQEKAMPYLLLSLPFLTSLPFAWFSLESQLCSVKNFPDVHVTLQENKIIIKPNQHLMIKNPVDIIIIKFCWSSSQGLFILIAMGAGLADGGPISIQAFKIGAAGQEDMVDFTVALHAFSQVTLTVPLLWYRPKQVMRPRLTSRVQTGAILCRTGRKYLCLWTALVNITKTYKFQNYFCYKLQRSQEGQQLRWS